MGKYDHVISGLPLNSFPPKKVQQFYALCERLTKEGGTFSDFHYRFLPAIRKLYLTPVQRQNFRAVLEQEEQFYQRYGTGKKTVYRNIPPAQVAHHRLITGKKALPTFKPQSPAMS
jgi:phospholipid N-methyltransferase